VGARKVGTAHDAERRRSEIVAEIATLGLPLPGSLVERRSRCGTPGCHCHADPPQLHGPYLSWTRKVSNKTVTRAVGAEQADRYREWMNNARRLRQLVAELETLAVQEINGATRPPI
jgi:hypothetical protein